MVKNRRKNGDYYWVQANVIPIMDAGRVQGYMSVRVKPSRQQVEAAASLYKKVREGSAGSIAFRQGRALRTGVLGAWAAVRHMPLSLRSMLFASVQLLLLGTISVAAWTALPRNSWLCTLVVGAAAVSGGCTLASWYYLQSKIVAPLKSATQVTLAMAGCDLTQPLPVQRTDELGQMLRALWQVNVNLRGIIGDVRGSVHGLTSISERVHSASTSLSQSTTEQAAGMEETSSSVEQMTASISLNTDNANRTGGMAVQVNSQAVEGARAGEHGKVFQ